MRREVGRRVGARRDNYRVPCGLRRYAGGLLDWGRSERVRFVRTLSLRIGCFRNLDNMQNYGFCGRVTSRVGVFALCAGLCRKGGREGSELLALFRAAFLLCAALFGLFRRTGLLLAFLRPKARDSARRDAYRPVWARDAAPFWHRWDITVVFHQGEVELSAFEVGTFHTEAYFVAQIVNPLRAATTNVVVSSNS